MAQSATYSFLDVLATIDGPGGSFSLGSGSGNSEEGISIKMLEDKNKMDIGADGSVMHSLRASKAGTVEVNLLKTSPVNAMLSTLYALQTESSALHGQNTISINNPVTGDAVTCQAVAFQKLPDNMNAKDGGKNTWLFQAGQIDQELAGLIGA